MICTTPANTSGTTTVCQRRGSTQHPLQLALPQPPHADIANGSPSHHLILTNPPCSPFRHRDIHISLHHIPHQNKDKDAKADQVAEYRIALQARDLQWRKHELSFSPFQSIYATVTPSSIVLVTEYPERSFAACLAVCTSSRAVQHHYRSGLEHLITPTKGSSWSVHNMYSVL